ncbi:replication-associated recombination protein A [candidate division KSB1 bacterium]
MDIFRSQNGDAVTPLAERIRPGKLSGFIGQEDIVGKNGILRLALEKDGIHPMILWGPPGTGKTTLALILAEQSKSKFFRISAVTSSVAEVKKIIEHGKYNKEHLNQRTVLFIDEIHRFNKAQQDVLLHSVEDGSIILIGATTENPSFEVISPLLSRCRIYKLKSLASEELLLILENSINKDIKLSKLKIQIDDAGKNFLLNYSAGDARILLNTLELVLNFQKPDKKGNIKISGKYLNSLFEKNTFLYDKKGDYHYDTISAFIKSMRGSDPDAAVFWLMKMIDGGEEPKFIARRMIIFASEDVGNADPIAMVVATNCFTAVTYVGLPEAEFMLAQTAIYLASAPKSNSTYTAKELARKANKDHPEIEVPLHLRNAPTDMMKNFGYGKGYKYPHSFNGSFVNEDYFPEGINKKRFYFPSDNGIESRIRERLNKIWKGRFKSDK